MIITSLTDSPVLKSQWHAQIPGIVFFCFFPEEETFTVEHLVLI